jgi:DDE superfamily endonuclease
VSALRIGADRPWRSKSIQPMAERLALGGYDQLHHFIAAGVWDAAPVERELLVQADRLVGGSDAVLVIDDTALAKKGTHSVGVAPPVRFGTQDRQLPDPGVAHAGARRSTGHAGVAVVSSAFWLCVGGCRLWAERAVAPGADNSQTGLGSRYSASPQSLPGPGELQPSSPNSGDGNSRGASLADASTGE